MIPVECPKCKSRLQAPDEAAGRTAKCKKCGSPITIPNAAPVAEKPKPNTLIAATPPKTITAKPVTNAVLEPRYSPPSLPQTANCPFCGEDVLATAKKCKHCGEILDVAMRSADEARRLAEHSSKNRAPAASSSSSSSTVVVINHRAFPHVMHLIITLVTCGFWLPIWLIHYLISPK